MSPVTVPGFELPSVLMVIRTRHLPGKVNRRRSRFLPTSISCQTTDSKERRPFIVGTEVNIISDLILSMHHRLTATDIPTRQSPPHTKGGQGHRRHYRCVSSMSRAVLLILFTVVASNAVYGTVPVDLSNVHGRATCPSEVLIVRPESLEDVNIAGTAGYRCTL